MRLAVLILAGLVMVGCASSREAGASAIQAQQASQGIAKVATGPEVVKALATMTPEQRQALEPVLRQIVDLANQAAESLSPVVARLTVDEPAAEVRTSVEQAVTDPKGFIADAQRQAGRAEAEVEHAQKVSRAWKVVANYGAALGDSLLSQLLLGGGTAGLLAAAGGIAMRAKKVIGGLHDAVGDAVSYAKDVEAVDPKDTKAIEEVRKKHKALQEANGTRDTIKSKLKVA